MKDEKSGLELKDDNVQAQDSEIYNQSTSKTLETETTFDLSTTDLENTNFELFELPIKIENDKEKIIQNELNTSTFNNQTNDIPEKTNLEKTNFELFELPIIIDNNKETIKEESAIKDTISIEQNIEENIVESPIEKKELNNIQTIEVLGQPIDNKATNLNNNFSKISIEPRVEPVNVQNNVTKHEEQSIESSKYTTIDNQTSINSTKSTKRNYYIDYKLRLAGYIGIFLILLINFFLFNPSIS